MKDTYEFMLNDQKVEFRYESSNPSPLKEVDTGTCTVLLDGKLVGDFPGQKTSFIQNPFSILMGKKPTL